MYLITEE